MIPEHFFYLVDIEQEKVLATFSIEDCASVFEVNALEAELRARHGVDDPDRGLALRHSDLRPDEAARIRRGVRYL